MIAGPTSVVHEHHARLMQHVDQIPVTADLLGSASVIEIREHLDAMYEFLTALLIPHMDSTERTLYPELERLMQNRHSMTPMRREHVEIRALVDDLGRRRAGLTGDQLSVRDAVALRRSLFRLYCLMKVHLAEERLYADIAEHGLSADAEAALGAAMEHQGIAGS